MEQKKPAVEIPEKDLVPKINEKGDVLQHDVLVGRMRFVAFNVQNGLIPDPRENLKRIKEMGVHSDDVFISAQAKSGTHWLCEIVAMLLKGTTEYEPRAIDTRMLEFHTPEEFDEFPRPRIFTTHLPYEGLPQKALDGRCKILWISRNPKDRIVSWYNERRNMIPKGQTMMSWEDHLYIHMTGQDEYIPWYEYISGYEAVLDERTDHILPLFYEDLKKFPVSEISKIAAFLGKDCTQDFVEEVADKCSFRKLKEADKGQKNGLNKDMNFMYRKGEIGDWKNWFTVAQSERFDRFIADKMRNSRFKFKFS